MLLELFKRDVKLALQQSAVAAVGFFLIVILIFVLSSTGEIDSFALGLIWATLLLAHLLLVPFFFEEDRASGILELLFLEIKLPAVVVLIKSFALWVGASVPLIITGLFVHEVLALTPTPFLLLMSATLIGSLGLVLLNSFAAALTCGLRAGAFLAPIIVLPLALPILIFGVSACRQGAHLFWQSAPFMLLLGCVLLVLATAPALAATALQGEE